MIRPRFIEELQMIKRSDTSIAISDIVIVML